MKISREDENNFPEFTSHDSARMFFKEKYGKLFAMVDVQEIDDQKCYFYNLVLDKEVYLSSKEKMEKGERTGLEFLNSYQRVEIFEDGSIHVVH